MESAYLNTTVQTQPTALFRVVDGEPASDRCGNFACESAGVATDPNVITGVVFMGLAVMLAFAYVRNARETCQHERRCILDERDAFTEFADRVKNLDPVSVKSAATNVDKTSTEFHRSLGSKNTVDLTLRQVLSIYKETVMSVPHYEMEYDETVSESLSAELGPDTVTCLVANGTVSSSAQRALENRSRKAAATRASVADAIETELDALLDADTELTSIDRRRQGLVDHLEEVNGDKTSAAIDIWNQLDDLETEIEAVATERQQSLRKPPMRIDSSICDFGDMAFYDYLYGANECSQHPVLSQVADLTGSIREDRNRLTCWIANDG